MSDKKRNSRKSCTNIHTINFEKGAILHMHFNRSPFHSELAQI